MAKDEDEDGSRDLFLESLKVEGGYLDALKDCKPGEFHPPI